MEKEKDIVVSNSAKEDSECDVWVTIIDNVWTVEKITENKILSKDELANFLSVLHSKLKWEYSKFSKEEIFTEQEALYKLIHCWNKKWVNKVIEEINEHDLNKYIYVDDLEEIWIDNYFVRGLDYNRIFKNKKTITLKEYLSTLYPNIGEFRDIPSDEYPRKILKEDPELYKKAISINCWFKWNVVLERSYILPNWKVITVWHFNRFTRWFSKDKKSNWFFILHWLEIPDLSKRWHKDENSTTEYDYSWKYLIKWNYIVETYKKDTWIMEYGDYQIWHLINWNKVKIWVEGWKIISDFLININILNENNWIIIETTNGLFHYKDGDSEAKKVQKDDFSNNIIEDFEDFEEIVHNDIARACHSTNNLKPENIYYTLREVYNMEDEGLC